MMNLRHLKLWKRNASSGGGASSSSSKSAGGGFGNEDIVRAAPVVDYDVRSPSSDSGYSDVVPASMSAAASTTASFGGSWHHHHHLQQQQFHQQQHRSQHHQLPHPLSFDLASPLEPELYVNESAARGATVAAVTGTGSQHKKRTTNEPPLVCGTESGMYRIAETSTTATMTPGNPDGRKNHLLTRPCAPPAIASAPRSMPVARATSARSSEAVTMDTLVGLVRGKDIERLKRVLSETKYDVNTRDSAGRTLLHHAVLSLVAEQSNDTAILKVVIQRGAHVDIKDETCARETALHIALRQRHLAAVELLLESPGCDVMKCGSLQRHRMLPEVCLMSDLYQPPVAHIGQPAARLHQRHQHQSDDDDETLIKSRHLGDQFVLSCRQSNTLRRLIHLDLFPSMRNESDTTAAAAALERLPVSDLVVVRDDRLPALGEILRRVEPETLVRMYFVGCRMRVESGCRLHLSRFVALRSLVLTQTRLRRLPDCVYDMSCLEVLKVDHNHLSTLSTALGRLQCLTTFTCDSQRPRLRKLPHTITRLHQLQVLSFSDNRVDSIDFVVSLPNLRVLRCDRNNVHRLPLHLVNLRHVTWLDISHNPVEHVPHQLLQLITGPALVRFDYFGLVRLRPVFVRRHIADLISHLRLEATLRAVVDNSATGSVRNDDLVCDMTVAIFGETGCGKTTLMRALKDQRGVCREPGTSKQVKNRIKQHLRVERFAMDVGELLNPSTTSASCGSPSRRSKQNANSDSNGGDTSRPANNAPSSHRCDVTTFAFSGDFIDAYTRQLRSDIRLLLVDMASLESASGNGANAGHHYNHQSSRHVTRTRMWLEALHELEPDAPVIIVGTHADLVRSTSGFEKLLDELFCPAARQQHVHRYGPAGSPGYCPRCLLCAGSGSAGSGVVADRKSNKSMANEATHTPMFKSRSSPAGRFDELSIQHAPDHDFDVPLINGYPSATSPEEIIAAASSSSPLHKLKSRDHRTCFSASAAASSTSSSSLPPPSATGTFPHVVGWAIVDSVRNFPKSESKKTNVSVERLRGLIGRLALTLSSNCCVPGRWSALARHIDSLGVDCGLAATPCLPIDDLVCMARSYDVDQSEVPVLLHWLHRRGRVVFFADSDQRSNHQRQQGRHHLQQQQQQPTDDVMSSDTTQFLSRFVATDAAWFTHQLNKISTEVVLGHGARQVDGLRLMRSVLGFDQAYVGSSTSAKAAGLVSSWMLAAAERLDVCVPLRNSLSSVETGNNAIATSSSLSSSTHFLPDLLEHGAPNRDAWPDRPELDERQVTCDMAGLRLISANNNDAGTSGFRSFGNLLVALCSSSTDRFRFRQRPQLDVVCDPAPVVLANEAVFFTALDVDGCPDCRPLRVCRRRRPGMHGNAMVTTDDDDDNPDDFDADSDCDGLGDDILHKIRLTLNPDVDGEAVHQKADALLTVRIQVRGPSPCCVVRAVIEFIELNLDSHLYQPASDTDVEGELHIRSPMSNGSNSGCHPLPPEMKLPSSEKNNSQSTTIANASDADQHTTVTSAMTFNSPVSCGDGLSGAELSTEMELLGSIRNPDDDGGEFDVYVDDDIDMLDSGRINYLLCPKCVLLGELRPERIAYHLARAALERPRRNKDARESRGRRCVKAVCSRWHNLGSWRRALTGDYRYGGSFSGPGGSSGGGLGGAERPVYSLAPMTLPDYEHPRLLLLLPPSAEVSERAWRSTARARFLEGHDLHVLCESPTAWHMIDGFGLRLPSQLPNHPGKRGEFSLRMLTVLDLSLAIVQLIQGANEHAQTGRLMAPVIVELLRTYEYLRAGSVLSSIVPHNHAASTSTPSVTSSFETMAARSESEQRREAELYLAANRDRVVTVLTRALTAAAQHSAAADSAQQADLYLKAGGSLGPDDVFGRGGAVTSHGGSSRIELGRFLRLETSAGRFGALRPIYVGGELRWVCEKHYVELRSMPSIQLHL